MNTHKVVVGFRHYSLPRTSAQPSIDAKLDRVFQMAENVDARCVYMVGAATHKRRPALAVR
jgi:hypothetical protein